MRLSDLARRYGVHVALWTMFAAGFVLASQNNTWSPTTGTVTGLQLTTNYNNAFSALQSCNSGNSAPANDQTLAAVKGQCWLNTSTTPNTVSMFDGTSWVTIGWLDAVNHFWIGNTGGNSGTIAAAATTDLGTVQNQVLSVTGSASITSFGSTAIAGTVKLLNFAAGSTLTHNATSLILPNGGANITTAAGDTAVAVALGAGNWRMLNYTRAAGTALSATANFTANVAYSGIISPAALAAGNTNNYAPAGLATAETIRLAGTAPGSTITGIDVSSIASPNGQQLHLLNVGTAPIVLTANDANSTAANRLQIPAPYVLGPDQSVALRYDTTTARWRMVTPQRAQPVAVAFKNLRIVNDGAAPTTTMDITADELAVEDANGNVVRLAGVSVAPVITGSGANGLDTGTVPPSVITWYSEIVIFNPATNAVAGLYSLQANCLSATLPAGYTYCARVGWNRTDAANPARWMRVLQTGRATHYVQTAGSTTAATPIIIQGAAGCVFGAVGTITTLVNANLANFVPSTAASAVVVALNGANGIAAGNVVVAPQNTAFYTTANNGPRGGNNVGWPVFLPTGQVMNIMVEIDLEAMTLGWCTDNAGGALYAWGWRDNL